MRLERIDVRRRNRTCRCCCNSNSESRSNLRMRSFRGIGGVSLGGVISIVAWGNHGHGHEGGNGPVHRMVEARDDGVKRRNQLLMDSGTVAMNESAEQEDMPAGVSYPRNFKLLQVQVAFRHGARTPVLPLVSNPEVQWYAADTDKGGMDLAEYELYKMEKDTQGNLKYVDVNKHKYLERFADMPKHRGGAVRAALTRVGMQQAIDLGARLRERYTGFIPSSWSAAVETNIFLVRSTITERTFETAQGVMTGLYPGQITKDLPAKFMIRGEWELPEWAVGNYERWCPRLRHLFVDGMRIATENCYAGKECKALMEELENTSGIHVPYETEGTRPYYRLHAFRDQLSCRHAHSKPISPDAKPDLVERTALMGAKHMFETFQGGTEENRLETFRLGIGRMLRHIIDKMDNLEDYPRFIMYSGHDWTLMPLLGCIDPFGKEPRTRVWAHYCADLAFELWQYKPNGMLLVRIVYNGEPIPMPGVPAAYDGYFYDIDTFKRQLQPFVLEDEETMVLCEMDHPTHHS